MIIKLRKYFGSFVDGYLMLKFNSFDCNNYIFIVFFKKYTLLFVYNNMFDHSYMVSDIHI